MNFKKEFEKNTVSAVKTSKSLAKGINSFKAKGVKKKFKSEGLRF